MIKQIATLTLIALIVVEDALCQYLYKSEYTMLEVKQFSMYVFFF